MPREVSHTLAHLNMISLVIVVIVVIMVIVVVILRMNTVHSFTIKVGQSKDRKVDDVKGNRHDRVG